MESATVVRERRGFASFYTRFRGSKTFGILVTAYLLGSVLLHWLIGYDPQWGATNLSLSIEATYNGIFLLILMERVEKLRAEAERMHLSELKHIRRTVEALLEQSDDDER